MKKTLVLFAAAVAALLAVSCVKETVNDNLSQAGMKKVSITACAEMTKTTYSETGAFSWTKGDKVSVLGDDKVFYTLTAQESGATVEFAGEVPEGVELTGKAFYPADELHACIEGEEYDRYEFNIPEYKDLTATFSADLPMGSYTEGDGMYSFKHMTGAALLTFSNLEDYTAVEITIANESLKLSGIFEPYTSEGLWTYGSKTAPEGGSKFIRKVAVADGIAQVYLPYPSNLWAASTIDIVGFNAEGKEFELLTGKTMKANYDEFPRATVIPYATLAVPAYVDPSDKEDVSNLDWTSEDVVTYTLSAGASHVALTELNVLVSEQFMNVRVKASKEVFDTLATPAMSVFLFDGDPAGTETYYGFWSTMGKKALMDGHTGEFPNGYELTLELDGLAVETTSAATDSEITWTFAVPRSTSDAYANDKGYVFLGVLLDNGWNQRGALPSRGSSMLKVKLFDVEGVEEELEAKDLPKLDWTSAAAFENDETAVDDFKMKEIRAFGDAKYLYVRLTTALGAPLDANYLDISFCDGDGEAEVWWGWTTTGTNTYWKEHKGAVDAAGNLTGMSFGTAEVLYLTEVAAESVTWYLAYPRESVAQYVSAAGKIYVSAVLWKDWGGYWAVPARWNDMLEVAL